MDGATTPQRVEGHGRHFDWLVDRNGSVLTVGLEGEIDIVAVREFEPTIEHHLSDEHAYVVIDLAGVTFIDSTGLRLLLRLKHRMEQRSVGSLLLGEVSQPVLRLLDVTGLTEEFAYANGDVPTTFHCPMCNERVSIAAKRCPECGSTF